MITVNNLHKSFGEVAAVKGVSFRALDGQITGLLGPNGAGKSTTLRMVYTATAPDEGSILIDEMDGVARPLDARRRLGVLPDSPGLYRKLTARQNIEYFARLHGLGRESVAARCEALIKDLGILDIADRLTEGFSQGQRIKTAIARALIHDPHNVVLDEPTNGMDVMSIRVLRSFLCQLREQGRCVIFSSHVMQEVERLCDQIVVISGGQSVAQCGPQSLKAATGRDDLEDAFIDTVERNHQALDGVPT
ncbi:ATP-binding cassette domain-containing protein [Xanthomonas hyacinthi]|uniref:ABC transporter n=1 Tax=Xanthomonas hyacinthi TaxID=56455 RepID=A0A2S7F1K1_9XANT|nr:ATP-binding cassette domain-containing protein [Xanthomonas hyacinthi]KLD78879.1 hypothetical protein Y886_07720 [Xanthomonas hyacinthi DSM 19077]PPU99300.1 ABC transporter [Xanthomonas hyacinthi]QGY78288.1 ATP-binding cassette domain-containing protein [Xanthomonas hyacinthi]